MRDVRLVNVVPGGARTLWIAALGSALVVLGTVFAVFAQRESAESVGPSFNGFDVTGSDVPPAEIHQGGPPRDGIPALTDPRFESTAEAREIEPDARVLGVVYAGVAKAYPLSIMNWHEIVNDRFGEAFVVVTYCPLCYTGMAFDAHLDGQRQLFGVSGLLYNSDVLLYDRASDSLWSQILGKAISGPRRGQQLRGVPVVNTTWSAWRSRHPRTLVLSRQTGHPRDYARDPYAGYSESAELIFPVRFRAHGYHPKEKILGIVLGDVAKAYPVSELSRASSPIDDRVGDVPVRVRYDIQARSAEIERTDGEVLPGVMSYWFAWYTFHPQTEVFKAGDEK